MNTPPQPQLTPRASLHLVTDWLPGFTLFLLGCLLSVKAQDIQFTKITEGPVVTDLGISPVAPAWCDLDNDGYPDLLVVDEGRWVSTNDYQRDVVKVYLNNRDGTFRRATEADIGPLAVTEMFLTPMSLVDYDNDGHLDVYEYEGVDPDPEKAAYLYRGGSDGKFTIESEDVGINRPVTPWYSPGGFYPNPWGKSWVDYDQDGFLDVYLTVAWNYSSTIDQLWRNNGDGTFSRALTNFFKTVFDSQFGCWSDYDNDGDPDVFVGGQSGTGRFYRNDGGGRFTDLTTSLRATLGSLGWYGAWGDYDNDGDLDLHAQTALCQNDGAGGFVKKTGANYPPETGAGTWIDYDNDGYLDYFSHWAGGRRLLMRNNRDGTFTRMTIGSVTEDPASAGTGAWADYDNNGFLDLMLCNRASNKPNDLYHNDGNENHWILVKLVGSVANRSAIGAKLRAQATIWGKSVQQMREVSGTPFTGDLRVHFGLGDATNVATLRIEWPSGTVQEIANVATNQILTVIEPRQPVLAVAVTPTLVTGTLTADTNQVYQIHASDDLTVGWTILTTITTDNSGKGTWSDQGTSTQARRFYKALRTQ